MAARQPDLAAVRGWPQALLARLVASAGVGLILFTFSEFVFMNEGPVRAVMAALAQGIGPTLQYLGSFGLIYMWFGYIFLIVLRGLSASGWRGLILAGAIAGWAIEALVIPLSYEAPPISFFWPSIGWHALIDVALGWFALRWIMRHLPATRQIPIFAAIGALWAVWATVFWAEDSAMRLPDVGGFAGFAALIGGMWMIGMILADRPLAGFAPTRGDGIVVAATAGPLFIAMGWPYGFWALALGALVALSLWALWRQRGGAGVEGPLATPPPAQAYLCAAAMPLGAMITFAVLPAEMPTGLSSLAVLPLLAIGSVAWALAVLSGVRSRPG